MKPLYKLAIAVCLLTATTFAQAELYTYWGDTNGKGTFNRPEGYYALSNYGTNVAYHEFDFTVSTSGLYTFVTTTPSYVGYAFLYSGFNPASPLSNLLVFKDNYTGTHDTYFSFYLTAATKYEYVNTALTNDASGWFYSGINGPGAVIRAVPEPETYAMLLAGLGMMGFAARRKKQA